MFLSIAIGVLVIFFVLSRQIRVRIVPRLAQLRLPLILGIIGFFSLVSYTGSHHVTATDYEWVLGTMLVGAVLLGALRALTVKIWTTNNVVVRQGHWLTMVLWVISLALHFASGVGAQHVGAANLEASSLLLYLGLTLGVQNYVVHVRAAPLWDALPPEAGRGMQVNFGAGPGAANAFFATFRGGPGAGPSYPPPSQYDPTIIDAEVVEDDDGDGPAQLRRPD